MKIQTKIIAMLFLFMALACSKDDNEVAVVPKSDAKAITSFTFNAADNAAIDENVTTTVTEASKTVSSTLANGINVSALIPTIQISAKASISPSGAQDFSGPVTYTVTAEDGSKASYQASVMVLESDAKQIVSFVFSAEANTALSEDVAGEIDEAEKAIAITLPSGTDVTALEPTFELPENASIEPMGPQNFSETVTYTVTAEDGSTANYMASVLVLASDAKQIVSFVFTSENNEALTEDIAGEIDDTEKIINIKVPSNIDVTAFLPTIEIPDNTSIDPSGPQDFSQPVTYTVTAEDGSKVAYVVSVELFTTQKEALIAIFNANPDNRLSWILTDDISTWEGVTLNENGNVKSLSLDSKGIENLPNEIVALIALESLSLSNNRIQTLPSQIGQLTNLEFLRLFSNSLTALPEEIGNLINLKKLDFPFNEVSELPSGLTNLTNLEFLEFTSNNISKIPQNIGQLTNLKHLRFNQNSVISIPISIGQLTNLTFLGIAGNELSELPSQIGQLTDLRTFQLSHNPLNSIPEFSNLVNLTELRLGNTRLNRIPNWVFNNLNLKVLELETNMLLDIPSEISQLSSLEDLRFSGNEIETLPEEIMELRNLRILFFRNNQITNLSLELCEWLDSIINVSMDDTIVCEN